MENTNEFTGVRRVFNVILTIFLLIAIILGLVFVWGDVINVHVYNNGYAGNTSYAIGLNYFIYDGWNHVAELSKANNNGVVTFFAYFTFVISMLGYFATIGIVYTFGIKGMIKGIHALVTRTRSTIFNYVAVMAVTIYGFSVLAKAFAFHSYGLAVFNPTQSISISDGWGAEVSGIFFWMDMVLVLIYLCFDKFNKFNVTHSIRNILVAVSFILLVNIVSTSMEQSYILGNGASKNLNLFEAVFMLFAYNLNTDTYIFLTISTILSISSVVFAIALFIKLLRHFLYGKEFNFKVILTLSGILAGTALLGMIFANPALKTLESTYGKSQTNLDASFALSLVVLTLMITSSCLTQKEPQSTLNN